MPIRAMSFADQTAFSVRGLPAARNVATPWVVYAGQYASAFEDYSLRVQASWAFRRVRSAI